MSENKEIISLSNEKRYAGMWRPLFAVTSRVMKVQSLEALAAICSHNSSNIVCRKTKEDPFKHRLQFENKNAG